ncbi:ribbon-helix-helix protein, CopG family [Nonomuraea dietziae]|uniref:ribbon-helix-helix protein, CopG family n=1 Tax=Nonomuraea dietziae TaxID=65515 RepID=UPI0034099722
MMAVKKISISLPEETLDEIARLAEREGLSVSAWLTQAAGHVIRREAGLAADNAAIVTSDPGDLDALLDAAKPAVRPSLIAV